MGSKLFKGTEDRMKEAMLGNTPVGKDIKVMLEKARFSPDETSYMAYYKSVRMYDHPANEILFLQDALGKRKLGLALCEESGLFFADLNEVVKHENRLRINVLKDEYNDSGIAWVVLVKMLWNAGVPIADVRVFMEGFEVRIFLNNKKTKKEFIRKPLDI